MFLRLKLIKSIFKPLNLAFLLLLLIILIPVGIYIVNPFQIESTALRPRIFGHDIYRIPSQSMLPALQPGDYILISNISYLEDSPKRGEIIVFKKSLSTETNVKHLYIKRIIGVGGDTVKIIKSNIYVNSHLLKEQYANPDNKVSIYSKTMNEVTVPKNKVFVLGDNRDNSNDSRAFGLVDENEIIGRAERILFGNNARSGAIE